MLAGVVLAAGESRRMGSPKALLAAPGGGTFVSRILRAFVQAGVPDVVVVTGSDHEAIERALDHEQLPARLVRNPAPARGQLSSLWVGMDAVVGPETDGLLVMLVDVPLSSPATIRRIIDAWHETRAPIVRPAIGARHGHPVLFDRALFNELRAAPLDQGAKAVVRAHEEQILNVAVSDEGCVIDVDTPDDYRRLPPA